MGKFLDYYCPFCGKEFSLFYENSICQNCSSAFYERYDYLPVRKIKRKTRLSYKNGDLMEDIIPVVKAGNVLNFKKQTSPNPLLNNDEKNIIVYFKHEAENILFYFAERGLPCVFSENLSKKNQLNF